MDPAIAGSVPQLHDSAGSSLSSGRAESAMEKTPTSSPSHARTVRRSLLVVGGMFAFGFLLVPLYDIFCEVTGINGKTSGDRYTGVTAGQVDESRTVRLQFMATTNDGMPWEFQPAEFEIEVHPGEVRETVYRARNLAAQDMVGQAVPSVSPGLAAKYLHKVECFCFQQQPLAAGADAELPLRFMIDPDLPDDVHTLTLSYTLFNAEQAARKTKELAQNRN